MESVQRKCCKLLLCGIVFVASVATFCLNPLKNELIYKKVAESHNATHQTRSCDSNITSEQDALMDQEASMWVLWFDLTLFVPAAFVGVLVTSWSDRVGRKTTISIPLLGMLISDCILATFIKLEFELAWMFLYNFIAGLGGYFMVLLVQGSAFLNDVTTKKERFIWFVILESSLSIGGSVGGTISGFLIQKFGYFFAVVFATAFTLFSLLGVLLLPDSRKILRERGKLSGDESSDVTDPDQKKRQNNTDQGDLEFKPKKKYSTIDLLRAVWSVYSSEYSRCEECHGTVGSDKITGRCNHGDGFFPGRIWRLWFYLISYDVHMYVIVGTMSFQTIFLLSEPLCFSPVLVGAQTGVKFASTALVPLVVVLLQKLRCRNSFILLVGLFGMVLYSSIMSVASQSYIVFIGSILSILVGLIKPMIKNQMAELVSERQIGAAFGLLSSTEAIFFMLATVFFLFLYPATLQLYFGFAWIFAAAISIIPCLLILVVALKEQGSYLPLKETNI